MNNLQLVIVTYLSGKNDYVPTLEIAKNVLGKDATKKQVNPALYDLMKKYIIIKHPDEKKPQWKLAERN